MTVTKEACQKVHDELAALVDGEREAVMRHADHLAECDECRDLRHEASEAAHRVARAGADFASSEDAASRLLAAIDARPKKKVEAGPKPEPKLEPKAEPKLEEDPPARPQRRTTREARPASRRLPMRRLAWVVPAFAAAGVLVAVALSGPGPADQGSVLPGARAGAKLTKIARAAEGSGGVALRLPGAKETVAAGEGAALPPGTTITTDARTRARLELEDGTVLVLNHGTELVLESPAPRGARLIQGELLADVAHVEGRPAAIAVPLGTVEVLGTQFILSATADAASVRVTRGQVRLTGPTGQVEVRPGEEGILEKGTAPQVAPAVDLASAVGWSELEPDPAAADAAAPGLGELRAKKPGESRDRERPLSLARHKVTVRVAGNVARTEIEEVFQNDGGDVLEGIYRFPLPADARIDRLALEVDGKLEEGAFVERARAAGIWRGVIHNATPKEQRKPEQELVWVPGPWRDPALLEWQKGGRFELKIFPIPARGSRRVIIAYTQVVPPHARGRRYVYPLAHSADRSTRVGRFEVEVRLAGVAEAQAHGYAMTPRKDGDATVLSLAEDGFLPAGDVLVDYQPAGGEASLRWWTFRGDVAVFGGDPAGARKKTDPVYLDAQRQVASDHRPFVVFAVRPELPAWTESKPRDLVVVVDSSQSMVGERYTRAARLAAALIAQMDRRDRFLLLACDVDCRAMEETPRAPSAQAARAAEEWLREIRPAGASDLARALAKAARRADDRETHVIYVGDGLASVGPRRAAALAGETAELATRTGARFTTVGIGADADALALSAVARAGGGQYVPYVPGERAAQAALAVLETTFGASLRDVEIQLPAGLEDLAPARLPTLRAGQELIVAARYTGEPKGDVVLRGRIGGRPWEGRWPVALSTSTAGGNAFVPRTWAALAIDRLELEGRGEDVPRIVGLSKAYGVMSRHTSLLVLESEAMFRAFGIDRARPALDLGDEPMEGGEAEGSMDGLAKGGLDMGFGRGAGRAAGAGASGVVGGSLRTGSVMSRDKSDRAAEPEAEAAMADEPSAPEPAPPPAATPPVAQPAPKPTSAPNKGKKAERRAPARRPPPPDLDRRGPGRWMRKVWYSVGQVGTFSGPSRAEEAAVAAAEQSLAASPDSRDRHRALALALSRLGDLERAEDVAEAWLERDRLDAEALATLSDVIARQGRRDEALRLLSGIVDLGPDDVALQERMARAYERAAMADRACAHRVAMAEIAPNDARAIGQAVRCQRGLGRETAAARLLDMATDSALRLRAEQAASAPTAPTPVRGALTVDASWSGGSDLDVSIVTPQGARVSWTGGRGVSAESIADAGRERIGLRSAGRGTWIVEVSRTRPGDATPVSGSLRIRAHGAERTVPFRLEGERAAVARVEVTRQFRLEEVWQ